MVQYLFDKFKIMYITRSLYNQRKYILMRHKLNVGPNSSKYNFSLEAFCRLCVARIPINQTSICILTYMYIDSNLLSGKTVTHVHPHISPWTFPLDVPPTFRPGHNPRTFPPVFIHSFIPGISIAPLQVLYYSEGLPTTARILYRRFNS